MIVTGSSTFSLGTYKFCCCIANGGGGYGIVTIGTIPTVLSDFRKLATACQTVVTGVLPAPTLTDSKKSSILT